MGKGKYDVEVRGGEEFGFAPFKPSLTGYLLALGTVAVAAGMIQDTFGAAVAATLNVAAKTGRAAVEEVGYDPGLIWWQGMGLAILCNMVTKDIGHFQLGFW
jgi:hypothetical protein